MEKGQLANRIRAFRKLKSLTQLEFALLLDISVGHLGAIERGNRKPNEQLLRTMADTLRISYDELVSAGNNFR